MFLFSSPRFAFSGQYEVDIWFAVDLLLNSAHTFGDLDCESSSSLPSSRDGIRCSFTVFFLIAESFEFYPHLLHMSRYFRSLVVFWWSFNVWPRYNMDFILSSVFPLPLFPLLPLSYYRLNKSRGNAPVPCSYSTAHSFIAGYVLSVTIVELR